MIDYLENLSEKMPNWTWNILVVLFSILIGIAIKFILLPLVKQQSTKEISYSILRSIIKHFNKIFTIFIPLLIFSSLLPLMKLTQSTQVIISKIVEILITLCFAIIIIRILRIFEDYLYHRFDIAKENNLKERKIRTQIVFIRKLLITLIVIITISIILLSFESMRKIGAGLLTGVGIGGVIIGFAAQKSLGNLLAGFQIAFTQPIRMDDVLIVEGEWGKVEEINLTYVVVNIWDKRRLVLPINYFIEKPFQNWTRTTAEILGTVFIYTDFDIPVEDLRQKLTELLKNNRLWDGKVSVLQVTDLKERTMEIRCLMSCRNSGDAFDLRCFIREEMIKHIRANFPESLVKTRISLANNEIEGGEK
ncbi:mechanosensitive ion channel family protein [Olivibacter domesticus]|uniref:Small-conductance mechanosensitive channel n=1 Tax=Olivibacter domesticus TaxID=407022 RepID=A0A1H7ZWU3_OLID1|nr:mechanosensitive ion channel domain-containing protein [Olivibacter domesticus]SEM61767.1 Small-conductance mechanosensitive channel [Olivibacter domesticus]